ncbi:nitroreductase [Iamia sp. SCSIO 61187]|uniref:nitroreductase family protein n=1 Tax=Iamia sp. SCSIO 61187 TaxID=2722752 RepID=UPI001C631661|nr:nitroreductase [Iamia sp. SCSIO 61187]QYG92046.1 nitroreductase [Iamia sp. SCSIO 61187]
MTDPTDGRADVLSALLDRRSTAALVEPGPTPAQLDTILRAATTAPDHGRIRPWRFVVVSGEARARFADALEDGGVARDPDLPAGVREKLRSKAFVAPTLVAVVAAPRPAKVERWEQVASAACTGYAIVLAAHALGLGAMWKSVPFRTGPLLRDLLGMGPDDELLGWVLVGTPADPASVTGRPEPDLTGLAFHLTAGGALTPH